MRTVIVKYCHLMTPIQTFFLQFVKTVRLLRIVYLFLMLLLLCRHHL